MQVILSYRSIHSIVVTMLPVFFICTLHLDKSWVLCLVSCVIASYLRYVSQKLLVMLWVGSVIGQPGEIKKRKHGLHWRLILLVVVVVVRG